MRKNKGQTKTQFADFCLKLPKVGKKTFAKAK